MFTDKKNVLQLTALLKAYDIKEIVLSPGSRNSPLSHTFAAEPFFRCHSVVDERSAGFYALGIIQATQKPVAVCCTSGSAALNYAPAVAEAFYQQLPLLVLTADRPASQIGQMLGQTLPQPGLYHTLVKKAVHLPEILTADDEWFCNRLINEALHALDHHGRGPVQINIPLSEPLFNYTVQTLPRVRRINRSHPPETFSDAGYVYRWTNHRKRMILVGQLPPDSNLNRSLETLATQKQCIVLCEHLANIHSPAFIGNFDRLLQTLSPEEKQPYAPGLLITMGGHIVSRQILRLIRQFRPQEHWHITETGAIADPYRQLTDVIACEPKHFTRTLTCSQAHAGAETLAYVKRWKEASDNLPPPPPEYPEEAAVQTFLQSLPSNVTLQLANSTSVRYAQHFPVKKNVHVFCNRGTSGIEGSLSTAVGYAAASSRPVYLLTGDLSFFYDMNGLWNRQLSHNLHIFLINNGRGGIFDTLNGLNQSGALTAYIAAAHHTSAKGWTESLGIRYLPAYNREELQQQLTRFTHAGEAHPVLLEYFCGHPAAYFHPNRQTWPGPT